ncbi:hypothetical protein K1T71_010043 [Dendrolimus kikuchii]|uniref:Uncharacterized protein n=1 Tax=Dendrolimus kikuchii TaxID=765133 RepID=A0ACC1CQR2_9NEOP|nr:hypothetical protein K1T71_010043 [Dendrolimus kikuchii]
MNVNLILLILFMMIVSNFECVTCTFTPLIQTKEGKLRGLRSISGQNRYYGIPYATSKRFQSPQTPPKWSGIFTATRRYGSCSQIVSFLRFGREDCLELDVYTPESAKPGDKLAVLVFIHGGAYYYGSKWHYDPEFLVTKNVIVVIINYRVGVFGFVCLNNIANLGLKDHVAALKWIKRNIAAFGGDPDNVTISGQSAGASAAAMHLLSKSSKGLFHKAILLSGTPLAPWAFNVEQHKAIYEDLSKITTVDKEEDAYNILLNATVDDLLSSCADTSINPRGFKYSPCVDTNFTDSFFHDTPHNIISSGDFNKVPMINGYTSVEGVLFYGLNNEKTLNELDKQFVEKLPSVFSWCSKNDEELIVKKLKKHYFRRKVITKSSVKGVVNFYSDWMAYSTSNAFSDLMVKHSDKPVYNYIFAYEGSRNFAKFLFGFGTDIDGASHSDDIFYIFKPGGMSLPLSSLDKLFIDRLTTMLTNFMKFGDPTPVKTDLLPVRWPATTSNRSLTMRLDQQLTVIDTPTSHRGQFFLNLLCDYGLRGYVPCESKMMCNRR